MDILASESSELRFAAYVEELVGVIGHADWVWRESVILGSSPRTALGDTAVDMTPRLDNAGALPTCPQPPQQQQKCVA